MIYHLLSHTAIYTDILSGDKACFVGAKKHNHIRNIHCISYSSHRLLNCIRTWILEILCSIWKSLPRKPLIYKGFSWVRVQFNNRFLSVFSPHFPEWFLRENRWNYTWRGIEVVITGLTRNQFESNLTRVRIPPSPPKSQSASGFSPFAGSFLLCE